MLTCQPKKFFRVTNGIIFFVCSTSRISPMFSYSHLSEFLCEPMGKQSAMSKGGQQAASREGSRQWQNRSLRYRRKRDKSTWYHAGRGARKILHKIWWIWSIQGISMNKKKWKQSQGNLCKPLQSQKSDNSQVSRQENAPTAEGNLCMQRTPKTTW